MPHRVRVADRFMKQSAEQLVTMAGAVITGLTNNPAFPAPTVDLKAVQAAADESISISILCGQEAFFVNLSKSSISGPGF